MWIIIRRVIGEKNHRNHPVLLPSPPLSPLLRQTQALLPAVAKFAVLHELEDFPLWPKSLAYTQLAKVGTLRFFFAEPPRLSDVVFFRPTPVPFL